MGPFLFNQQGLLSEEGASAQHCDTYKSSPKFDQSFGLVLHLWHNLLETVLWARVSYPPGGI
jgi:hypothetical protein